MKKYIAFFAFLLASISNALHPALATDLEQKIYIRSDQIICTNEGIFVFTENAERQLCKILVPQLNWDENGLFVSADHLPSPEATWCRCGHKACDKCYRCNVPDCPSYG